MPVARAVVVFALILGLFAGCRPITREGGLPRASDAGAATEAALETDAQVPSSMDGDAVSLNPEQIAAGRQAYLDNYCGVCHRLDVAGTAGTFGPAHDHMGTIAAERIMAPNYRGEAVDAAGYIRESLVAPHVYLVETYEVTPHRMPGYGHLDEDALDALVVFLLAQE